MVPFTLIFLGSIFGNSVLIHIIRTISTSKTTINYLILYQAVADLLISIARLIDISIPSNYVFGYPWFGGLTGIITCKLYHVFLLIPPVFSVWLLVMIAVERLYAVARPLRLSPLTRHLKKFIFGLWIWCSASLSIIFARGLSKTWETFQKYEEPYYCNLSNSWISMAFCLFNTVFCFFLITVLYVIVCYKLWLRKIPGEGNSQNQRQAEARRTAKRITLMMIGIVLLYAICWISTELVIMLHYWNKQLPESVIKLCGNLIVFFSCLNPYIYFTFIQSFRTAFKGLFGNFLKRIKIHRVLPFRSQGIELQQI